MQKSNRALVAMSGGVDSAVAAFLTLQEAQSSAGAIMELCCGDNSQQIQSAKAIADRLGMPFHVLDMRQEFSESVIQDFVDCYEKGHTPNPCIRCNTKIKFGKFVDWAKETGFDSVVTGHYARIEKKGDRYLLRKAVDEAKDQSYFLYTLTQEQLECVRFPLGEMTKEQAREIAEANSFENAKQRDSQDICFVPGGDYASVIRERTGKEYEPGEFVTPEGQVLGQHKGVIHYTIGQRRGLGLAVPESVYVHRVDVENNKVIVGSEDALFSKELMAHSVNWVGIEEPKEPVRVKARVRYRQKEQWAWAQATGDGTMKVVFDEPQRAITPGQSVVLYDGEYVVGGGVIQ